MGENQRFKECMYKDSCTLEECKQACSETDECNYLEYPKEGTARCNMFKECDFKNKTNTRGVFRKIQDAKDACNDDPSWRDTKFGGGEMACQDIAKNPSWCKDYGKYSMEARRACPATCGCTSGTTSIPTFSPSTTSRSLHLTNDTPTCRNPHNSDPESWDCACHEEIVMACPVSALSLVDVNQTVRIETGTLSIEGKTQKIATLSVNGTARAVKWRNGWHDAKHEQCKNCTGKITGLDAKFKGKVKVTLSTGKVIEFENPALNDTRIPFDKACYRSKLCHSSKVCQSWKSAVCTEADIGQRTEEDELFAGWANEVRSRSLGTTNEFVELGVASTDSALDSDLADTDLHDSANEAARGWTLTPKAPWTLTPTTDQACFVDPDNFDCSCLAKLKRQCGKEAFRKQLTPHTGKTTSVTGCYHFFACTHSQTCKSYKDKHCKKEQELLKMMQQKKEWRVETC